MLTPKVTRTRRQDRLGEEAGTGTTGHRMRECPVGQRQCKAGILKNLINFTHSSRRA